MKIFTLYIGTSTPGAGEQIVRIIKDRFDSFTVISGEGFFKGKPEPMWFVKIATTKPFLLLETAESIRSALNQEGVGIEYEGRYFRCTANDPATPLRALLEAEFPADES